MFQYPTKSIIFQLFHRIIYVYQNGNITLIMYTIAIKLHYIGV